MRRRDLTIGLLLATALRSARAQEQTRQRRIAIVRPAGSIALISDTGIHFYREFFKELRRLGDVEGQNLIVVRYSGEGRPERLAELAREVVNREPDVIVAVGDEIAQAAHAADDTMPILLVTGADPIRTGLITSLARPAGSVTGVMVQQAGSEIDGKRLQILKEAVPSVAKVAYLDLSAYWEASAIREYGRRLQISVTGMLLRESNPTEVRRVFADLTQDRPDAIMVYPSADLTAYHQLIVELANKSRLPAMYPWREYVEAGGLMSYGGDLGEIGRRAADDVHEILNGAKPADIPFYQMTRYELVINLKAAKELGLTIPPILLARADEVIE